YVNCRESRKLLTGRYLARDKEAVRFQTRWRASSAGETAHGLADVLTPGVRHPQSQVQVAAPPHPFPRITSSPVCLTVPALLWPRGSDGLRSPHPQIVSALLVLPMCLCTPRLQRPAPRSGARPPGVLAGPVAFVLGV